MDVDEGVNVTVGAGVTGTVTATGAEATATVRDFEVVPPAPVQDRL
jgi:hypothetical protein